MTRAAKLILGLKFSSNNIIRALRAYVDLFFLSGHKLIFVFNYIITLTCYAAITYVHSCVCIIYIYMHVYVSSVLTISITIAVPISYIVLQLTTNI